MVYCTKCGKKNDDAKFCIKCGFKLDNQEKEDTFEKNMKTTAKIIEEKAEEFGKAAEKVGQKFERKIEDTFKNVGSWYDKKFKIFGPLVLSFLGLIILRFIIWLFALSGDTFSVFDEISDFLYSYLLIFFGLMLLNSYNSYFNRNYKKHYRWIYPTISTISFAVGLFIVSMIFIILDKHFNITFLTTIANFIQTYIILIFVIVLVLSYIFMVFSSYNRKDTTS
jgi:hypothetical protein